MPNLFDISVTSFEDDFNQKDFAVVTFYIIVVNVISDGRVFQFRKRFSDFSALCADLMSQFEFKLQVPAKSFFRIGAEDNATKESRRKGFDAFLKGMLTLVTNQKELLEYFEEGL